MHKCGGFFLSNIPGKRLPCPHGQVFALLRSALDARHWYAASFAGQRAAQVFPGAVCNMAVDREGFFLSDGRLYGKTGIKR